MIPDEKQLDRLAQWLDGQKIALDDQELAWGQDFCADEQDLAGRLDIDVPADVMSGMATRLTAMLAKPTMPDTIVQPGPVVRAVEPSVVVLPARRVARWSLRRVVTVVSAAAVIMLAVAAGWTLLHSPPQMGVEISVGPAQACAADVPMTPYISPDDKVLDQLARQIEATEKTFAPAMPSPAGDDVPAGPLVWPDEPPKLPRS